VVPFAAARANEPSAEQVLVAGIRIFTNSGPRSVIPFQPEAPASAVDTSWRFGLARCERSVLATVLEHVEDCAVPVDACNGSFAVPVSKVAFGRNNPFQDTLDGISLTAADAENPLAAIRVLNS
jgi:hypothetical protein